VETRGRQTRLVALIHFEMTSHVKIRLEGIHKAFRVKGTPLPVLEGVDLYAREGEFVALIGPSGCGKSTLLNVIAGLDEPDSGLIELDGRPSPRRLGRMGYMQQKDLLMPWRTVVDNAVLALELRGVSRSVARRRALELIDVFGLRGFEGQLPFALSGGMRQRVAFLRTLLADSDILLLDEPFGALDAYTRAQMQQWLLEVWRAFRKTIVFISHDVEEALFLSDRMYVLTARPARVKLEVTVDVSRPRTLEVVTSEPFVKLKGRLLTALYEGGDVR